MKHINIMLIIFIVILFVAQPEQAGATSLSAENPSQINAAPANTNILYPFVYVYVYKLVDGSGAIQNPPQLCSWPLDSGTYGCGYTPPPIRDSLGGFFYLNVEQDYLPDVLATEMNLAQIPPHIEALKSQAIASRTVASWKTRWAVVDPKNWTLPVRVELRTRNEVQDVKET